VRVAAVIVLLAAAGLVALALAPGGGRGSDDGRAATPGPVAATPTPAATAGPKPRTRRPRHPVRRARCPAGAANCAAVTGRVLYVEAVDPDGDGDAHYVLLGGDVTAPGISAIDIERALRPRRLARPGDVVSAAGPVYTGSHGQQQIQATEVHQQRR
jgi:hypothetical protein